MAGDVTKASLWADADVWVAADVATVNPATAATAFGVGWDLVGLLDGDEGFVQSRDEDETDFFAWGGLLVRTARKNFKLTYKFTALEDNDTTRALLWPGSSATTLVVPRPVPVKLALELREGNVTHRRITKDHAVITLDKDLTESESDLTKYPFVATIYPNAAGELFDVQDDEDVTAP